MSQLFALVARPLATPDTPGAFLNGLRLMAVDGTVFDVPDTEANAGVLGYPGSRPGTQAAFPKARLVLLVEAGTHLIADALMCPYRMGERVRALKLLLFSGGRDAVDVGSRAAFVQNGQSHPGARVSHSGSSACQRQI